MPNIYFITVHEIGAYLGCRAEGKSGESARFREVHQEQEERKSLTGGHKETHQSRDHSNVLLQLLVNMLTPK